KEKYHQEFERLITDPEYRKQRGDQVKNSVISEEQFQSNLSKIMLKSESDFKLKIGMDAVYTEEFRLTYFERFVKTHLRPVNNG
ncbi:MAG: hypothetical protein IJ728_11265, partial [Selenomonadaceae bacterium]|nr:hypothetical protein [Selenomonadaceae bacterium]